MRRKIGLLGYATILIGVLTVLVSLLITKRFNWFTSAISDFGVYPKTALIFNTGFIITGILLATYSIMIIIYLAEKLERIPFILLFIAGAHFLGIGLIPENIKPWHVYLAIGLYLSFGIFLILIGILYIRYEATRTLGLFALIIFINGLAIWLIPWKSLSIKGIAIPEVLSAIPAIIWLVVYNTYLIKPLEKCTFSVCHIAT